jgi:hypothetical protein
MLPHVRTGKMAPIDVKPDPRGNVVIDYQAETYGVLGKAVRQDARNQGLELHMAHHLTCPEGSSWRRPK